MSLQPYYYILQCNDVFKFVCLNIIHSGSENLLSRANTYASASSKNTDESSSMVNEGDSFHLYGSKKIYPRAFVKMESLLDKVETNDLDALYLFITEALRDRVAFDRFFQSLLNVLQLNWSVQRVEVGHEWLSMVQHQELLFTGIAQMESLRTLIFSDGYVPRKDYGTIDSSSLLLALPKARNLTILDIQRLELESVAQVEQLADVCEGLEGLEEVRITSLYFKGGISLDPLFESWVEMANLKSLTVSTHPDTRAEPGSLISSGVLKSLLQDSTTLQELTLRAMHLDDTQCKTMATALTTNSFLTSLDIRQNSKVGMDGYDSLLEALELNHGLWCSVMVDSSRFQGLFNLLIDLNQAGRGDLLRSPSLDKLASFIAELYDKTALWFFLRIHNTIRDPLIEYLQWKLEFEAKQASSPSSKRIRLS